MAYYQRYTLPESCSTPEDLTAALKYMAAHQVETLTLPTTFTKREEVTALLKHVSSAHREASTELCEYSPFAKSLSYGYRGYEGREYQINLTRIYSDGFETAREQIDAVTAYCRETLDSLYAEGELRADMTQKEKLEVLCGWVVLNHQYDLTYTRRDPYRMMTEGSGVCEGYTALYTMLCRMEGIPIQAEQGIAYNGLPPEGGAHIWNRLDNCEECGGTHFIDTTWCDPIPDRPGQVNWEWFWVDGDLFGETHVADTP